MALNSLLVLMCRYHADINNNDTQILMWYSGNGDNKNAST